MVDLLIEPVPDVTYALDLLGEAADGALWLFPARLYNQEEDR